MASRLDSRGAADPSEIGSGIRRRRLALGLTLDGLAEASGVSAAMLSEVERGVKNPTVKLAYQIARALGCSLGDLIKEDAAQPVELVRASERRTLVDPESGVERHGLSRGLLERGLEIVQYVLPPGASAGEMAPNRPGIVEHLTVVRGVLELVLGGESHELGPGDSVTYGPQATTEYRTRGPEPCEFLLVSDSSRAG